VNRGVEGAVLITGVYGSGKSSVAQEIANLLEKQNAPYARLDLDFLGWFDAAGEGGPTEQSVMLKNLAALVGNYLAVGVRFFVLAGAIRDGAELDDLKAKFPMPLRVVRLTVPLPEIEKRLRSDATTGRRADLREAAACAPGSTLSARRRDASPRKDWAMRHLRYVHRCKRHPRTCARPPLGTRTGALCNFRKL
jgi:hypothetical protein